MNSKKKDPGSEYVNNVLFGCYFTIMIIATIMAGVYFILWLIALKKGDTRYYNLYYNVLIYLMPLFGYTVYGLYKKMKE